MFNTTSTIWSKFLAPAAAIFGLIAFHDVCHATHVPWDKNWDYLEAETEKSVACKFGFRLKSNRNLFFVRHGHYEDKQSGLSCLGKEQAKFAARRLKEMRLPYNSISYSGTLQRGKETSRIIARCLPGVKQYPCDLIHSGVPIQPVPEFDMSSITPEEVEMDGNRMEEAFHKYFYRPGQNQSMDSYEIIVCPANVIRYFVCRAMQFPPEAWRRFSLHSCSITWLQIGDDGTVTMYGFGDFGHLPNEKLTL